MYFFYFQIIAIYTRGIGVSMLLEISHLCINVSVSFVVLEVTQTRVICTADSSCSGSSTLHHWCRNHSFRPIRAPCTGAPQEPGVREPFSIVAVNFQHLLAPPSKRAFHLRREESCDLLESIDSVVTTATAKIRLATISNLDCFSCSSTTTSHPQKCLAPGFSAHPNYWNGKGRMNTTGAWNMLATQAGSGYTTHPK